MNTTLSRHAGKQTRVSIYQCNVGSREALEIEQIKQVLCVWSVACWVWRKIIDDIHLPILTFWIKTQLIIPVWLTLPFLLSPLRKVEKSVICNLRFATEEVWTHWSYIVMVFANINNRGLSWQMMSCTSSVISVLVQLVTSPFCECCLAPL